MTKIYILTILGPVSATKSKLISYNNIPIVCASTKEFLDLASNKKLQETITNIIYNMGTENIPRAFAHIRTISNNLEITDTEIPLQELVDKWQPKTQEKSSGISGVVNGHI